MANLPPGIENRSGSEPEWMPPVNVVARERQRLLRRGTLASLRQAATAGPPVPPGEIPWLWWGGAVLWVVLWPALIALEYAGHFTALSWWLLPSLAMTHMLILTWPVLVSVHATSGSSLRRRFSQVQTLAQMLALEPEEFELWSSLLFQLMGYRVRNTSVTADHGIDLELSGADLTLGLVQCKRYRGTVGEPIVRDLYGTLVAAGGDRAWLVTTGAFSRQAREWAAGKPIELWDGLALVDQVHKYRR